MKAEKRPRRKRTRIPDLILLLIQVSVMILFIYTLINLNMLNFKWLVLIIALLFVLLAMFTVLMIMKLGRGVTTVKRVVQVLLIAVMLVGNHYAGTLTNTLKTITNETQTRIDKISLLTLADNDGNSIEDFNGKTIGLQTGTDKDLTEFALGKIDQRIEYGKYEYVDYSVMINDFLLGYDDAILINDAYIKMMADSVEGFAGSYKVIETFTREIELTPAEVNAKLPDEPFAVYLSGMDELGDPHQQLRSDVNILMLVDPVANHVTMISIPRDAYVPIADGGNNQGDKLTHAGIYGVDASIHTLENLYGIKIDYYVRLNFTSFLKLVDLVGGIDVENDQEFTSLHGNYHFPVGKVHLDSEQALGFVRERYSLEGGDNDRGKNQEKVIAAIIHKLTSTKALSNYNEIISGLQDSLQTNMPLPTIMNLVNTQLETGGSYKVTSQAVTGQGRNDLPSYAMPGSALYMMELNADSVAQAKEKINQTMEGKNND